MFATGLIFKTIKNAQMLQALITSSESRALAELLDAEPRGGHLLPDKLENINII